MYENPSKACYLAEFPQVGSNKVGGYITFTSLDGIAKVNVKLSSLEPNLQYHIHEAPVDPLDPTCESTKGHLDPYKGEFPCGKDLSKCEVGDLSGKYGNIDFSYFETEYLDPYISLIEGDPSFIGGKSVTIHLLDGTRYACSNIVPCKKPKAPKKEEEKKEEEKKKEEKKKEEKKEEPKEDKPKNADDKKDKKEKNGKKDKEEKNDKKQKKNKHLEDMENLDEEEKSALTEEKHIETTFSKKPHTAASSIWKDELVQRNESSSGIVNNNNGTAHTGTEADQSTMINIAHNWKRTSSVGSVILFVISLLV